MAASWERRHEATEERGGAECGAAVLFDAVYSDAELVFSLPVPAWRKYELESRPPCVWDERHDAL